MLFDLLADSETYQFERIFGALQHHAKRGIELGTLELAKQSATSAKEEELDHLAKRQANATVALYKLGATELVWPRLRHSEDPSVRSYIVHLLGELADNPRPIRERLEQNAESDVTIRRAMVLALGEYSSSQWSAADRQAWTQRLLRMYEDEPDAGLRGSAEWLLRKWNQSDQLVTITKKLRGATAPPKSRADLAGKGWYVNSQGQTMVVVSNGVFKMGSPDTEAGRKLDEPTPLTKKINCPFAISAHDVTRDQWNEFLRENPPAKAIDAKFAKTGDAAQGMISWYAAAAYCNWLSEKEGLPPEQQCYRPNPDGKYSSGMTAKNNISELQGYRLPTEVEWEFACRAGALTSRYYGRSTTLLTKYAWFLENAEGKTWTVGSLKPNDFGLFDMHGNVWDWCHDRFGKTLQPDVNVVSATGSASTAEQPVMDKDNFPVRGGAFSSAAANLRSAYRGYNQVENGFEIFGFRPARTIQP